MGRKAMKDGEEGNEGWGGGQLRMGRRGNECTHTHGQITLPGFEVETAPVNTGQVM